MRYWTKFLFNKPCIVRHVFFEKGDLYGKYSKDKGDYNLHGKEVIEKGNKNLYGKYHES